MANHRDFDLAIVGNGAIANAIALQFADRHPDARVAIIGPARRPGCASLAAGAMLNVFAELEAGALDYPTARAKFDVAVGAAKLWETHLERLNGRLQSVEPVQIRQGTYVVQNALTDDGDARNLDAIVGYFAEYGQRVHEVDPRDISGLKPAPKARPVRAIFLEDEGAISAHHLHRAYDEAFARAANVRVFDASVESIAASDKVRTLHTSSGLAIAARHVVIAAGSRTQAFVDQFRLAAKIPRLVYGVGVSLVVKSSVATEHVVRMPNRRRGCGVYVVPYSDGYSYVCATSFVSAREVSRPRVQAVAYLLQAAMEQVNTDFAAGEIHKTIVGYRPTTLDGYPLLGQTSIDGVWIASGTKRDGFHMSPKIADEFVRALHLGQQPFGGRFKPERSLILEVKKAEAIDRAVASIVSSVGLSEEEARHHVDDAYARAGLADHDYGIPPELLEMYRQGHARANIETLLSSE